MRRTRDVATLALRRPASVAAVLRGHPWIWREALGAGLEGLRGGEEVQVVGPDGAPVGRGLADPGSPIAVRLWTRGEQPVDAALLRARVAAAMRLRTWLFANGLTTAYRVVNGEGDRMPGFVVDRYADVAVVRVDGDGAEARLDDVVAALWPALEDAGVRSLVRSSGTRRAGGAHRGRASPEPAGQAEPRLLRGAPPPTTVRVQEHGVPWVVDLAHGQKTGAFLDQRENRRRVGQLARGRRVLNLFSYTGGFGLHAALGGATHVTNVDVATQAHATAQESLRAAGVDPRPHAFVAADVKDMLERARRQGDTWDLVVSDPPSYAPSEKALPRALAAYRALHRACAEVLAPGGILCAASCSSHVDAATFLTTLDDSAMGRADLSLLELTGAGADHPTIPGFPEGRYLKFAVLAAPSPRETDAAHARSRS
jgi:23S rRNA (cytosine1962-C5)-methyltransferase